MADKVMSIGFILFVFFKRIFCVYQLSAKPEEVILGDNVTITLTCKVDDNYNYVGWAGNSVTVAIIKPTCNVTKYTTFDSNSTELLKYSVTGLTYSCNISSKEYFLHIPSSEITADLHNVYWRCNPVVGVSSDSLSIYINVPVSYVTIQPTSMDKTVRVEIGQNITLVCITAPSRPAAEIYWYIGGINLTSQTAVNVSITSKKMNITNSSLVYTAQEHDHNKTVYCTAGNIPERSPVTSDILSMYILLAVSTVTLELESADVIERETVNITCSTGPSRPAASISWFIGNRNVTSVVTTWSNEQEDGKFISRSVLTYTGNNRDYNQPIFCQASNIKESHIVNSNNKTLYIYVPVPNVTIQPTYMDKKLRVEEGQNVTLFCITGPSRPAPWIQWYIGDINVTNQAAVNVSVTSEEMYLTNSSLVYTGEEIDHNKTVYCTAGNIPEKTQMKSDLLSVYIRVAVSTVTLETKSAHVVEKEIVNFTCKTGPSRPAASLSWFIGNRNVTSNATTWSIEQEDEKIISRSVLTYTGNNTDHNQPIFCQATNIKRNLFVNSNNKTLYIYVPVSTVTLISPWTNNRVEIELGHNITLICETSPSRPAAEIQWYIGGTNVTNHATIYQPIPTGDKYVTNSTLVYTGKEEDHNKTVYCVANNIAVRKPMESDKMILFIQYGPSEIAIIPNITVLKILENRNITNISCLSACRPNCEYVWSGPLVFNFKGASLVLINVHRNQSGQYTCLARNKFGNASSHLDVVVEYKPNVFIRGNNTVYENEPALLQCMVDSNPLSNITWIFSSVNNSIHTEYSKSSSEYKVEKANCLQTGNYQCLAKTVIQSQTYSAAENMSLAVMCSPRLDFQHTDTKSVMYLRKDEPLNLTVYLISYPPPLVNWTFTGKWNNLSVALPSVERNKLFRHVTFITKDNVTLKDFGNYTMTAGNGIGEDFSIVFIVIPQRPPESAKIISVTCDTTTLQVNWKPGHNGGNEQTFHILLINTEFNTTSESTKVTETSAAVYAEKIQHLTPDTNYSIQIVSVNKNGNNTSKEQPTCRTNPEIFKSDFVTMSLIGGTVGTSFAAVIVLVVIVFIRRRHTKKGEEDQPISPPEQTSYNEDELKSNPLYITSESLEAENTSSRDLTSDENAYTLVQKPKKGKLIKEKASTNDNVYKMDDIISKPECNNSEKIKGNDVEMNYAELVFDQVPCGGRFIIHGLEDRTIYADVDTTQKIEPLPDSDVEEDEIYANA